MPACANCGSHVTPDYIRVFKPDDEDEVQCCPKCPERVRGRDGRARRARTPRPYSNEP